MLTISITTTCADLVKKAEPKESNLTELITELLVQQKKTNLLLQTITEQNEALIKHNRGTTVAIKQQTDAIKQQTQVLQNPVDNYNDAHQDMPSMPLLMPAQTPIQSYNASPAGQNYTGYQEQQFYSPNAYQADGKVFYLMRAPYLPQPE